MKASSHRNRFFSNPALAIARAHEIATSEQCTAFVVQVQYGPLFCRSEYSVRLEHELAVKPSSIEDWLSKSYHELISDQLPFFIDVFTPKIEPVAEKKKPGKKPVLKVVPVNDDDEYSDSEPVYREIDEEINLLSYSDFHLLNAGFVFKNAEGDTMSKIGIYYHYRELYEDDAEFSQILKFISTGTCPGIIAKDKPGWKQGVLKNA